jgi:uncharacterized lipoprotein YbaY
MCVTRSRALPRAVIVLGVIMLLGIGTGVGAWSLHSSTPIEGTHWQLTQYLGPGNIQIPALASSPPTATLYGGTMIGSTGCNSYNSTYTLDGSNLTIKPGIMTLRACPDPIEAQEQAFLANMRTVTGYAITGTTLTMTNAAGGAALTFTVAPPASTGMTSQPTSGSIGQGGTSAALTGTVTYRQRIALPPGAVVNVQLADVSRADAPATIIGEQTIMTAGEQVPIPFRITYDPAAITASHSYSVRATISVGGQVVFRTTTASRVITNGNPTQVDLVLDATG